jgi:hypothetical protein
MEHNLPAGVTTDSLENQLIPAEFEQVYEDYYKAEGYTYEVAYELWLKDQNDI